MQGENTLFESHELLKSYIDKKSAGEEEDGVIDYLKNINYTAVADFPKGFEWFNVSEELSFTNQLNGKIILLDFFTYCCINCMHILPDLKEIENEFSIEDGLVVIGVHSAKFDNEKHSANILSAIQRYNISHPVINDSESSMWKNCDIQCWPTLLLLGPSGNPIVMLTGEGHKDALHLYIRASLSFYTSKKEISHHRIPLQPAYHFLPALKGPLLFPGKITCYKDSSSEIIAISDTGNHRVLILNTSGVLLYQVGGRRSGFKDGSLDEALFNAPQGLVFQNKDVLFVADTENHAIRKINLQNGIVATVAGTGEQGDDHKGGKDGVVQDISSPWDVVIYKTSESKEMLLIAMAGTHQIWALFLDEMVWWKNQRYAPGICVCIAGSGKEENRNNQYPHAAAFAQPSGLVICYKNKEVYIADSESSSIRRLSLVDGKVSAVVGGDRNPNNLFSYGDKDGKLYDAKLQHPLGLTMSKDDNYLYVADTYNHKIKMVDITTNTISTLDLKHEFNEPGGLCTSSDGKKLYIADTNNHHIQILDKTTMHIEELHLKLDNHSFKTHVNKSKLEVISTEKPLCLSNSGGKLIIKIRLEFNDALKLADSAPQRWVVDLPNSAWSCTPSISGNNVTDIDVVLSIPPMDDNMNLDIIYSLMMCTTETCVPKSFIIRQVLSGSESSPTALNIGLDVVVGVGSIVIKNALR